MVNFVGLTKFENSWNFLAHRPCRRAPSQNSGPRNHKILDFYFFPWAKTIKIISQLAPIAKILYKI